MQPGEIALLSSRVSEICGLKPPEPNPCRITYSSDGWSGGVPEELDKGLDALGVYTHVCREIEIYSEKCRQLAETFGWAPEAVRDVVLIHEISHMAHHLGRDEGGSIGECFGKNSCSRQSIEEVAQETTLAVIRQHHPDLEPVFVELSDKCQPSEYRNWKEFQALLKTSPVEALDRLRSNVQALRAVDRTCLTDFQE